MNFPKSGRRWSICAISFLYVLFAWLLPAIAQEKAEELKSTVAEPPKPSVTVAADVLNQYIFRGVALSRGDTPVIQPSIAASYLGFTLNVWGNLDTRQSTNNPLLPVSAGGFVKNDKNARWNETDITLSYSKELFKNFTATAGTTYYQLSNSRFDAYELYGGIGYAFPWFILGFTTYKEITHTPGWWMQFDITKSIPIPCYEGMSLDLGASFGYQILEDNDTTLNLNGDLGDYSEFQSATLQAALKIPVHKNVTIAPKVGVALPLSSAASRFIEANSWDKQDIHVFGGLNVTASF